MAANKIAPPQKHFSIVGGYSSRFEIRDGSGRRTSKYSRVRRASTAAACQARKTRRASDSRFTCSNSPSATCSRPPMKRVQLRQRCAHEETPLRALNHQTRCDAAQIGSSSEHLTASVDCSVLVRVPRTDGASRGARAARAPSASARCAPRAAAPSTGRTAPSGCTRTLFTLVQ